MRAALALTVLLACVPSAPSDEAGATSSGDSTGASSDDESGLCNGCDVFPIFAVGVDLAKHTNYETLDAACAIESPGYRAMMLEETIWPGDPLEEPASRLPQIPTGVLFRTLCSKGLVGDYEYFRDVAPMVCGIDGKQPFATGYWIGLCTGISDLSFGQAPMRRRPADMTFDAMEPCDVPGAVLCLPEI